MGRRVSRRRAGSQTDDRTAGRAAPASNCSRSAGAPPARARRPGARGRRESRARARSRARQARASPCRRRYRGLPPKPRLADAGRSSITTRRPAPRRASLSAASSPASSASRSSRPACHAGHGLRLPQGQSRAESRVPPGCRRRRRGADSPAWKRSARRSAGAASRPRSYGRNDSQRTEKEEA